MRNSPWQLVDGVTAASYARGGAREARGSAKNVAGTARDSKTRRVVSVIRTMPMQNSGVRIAAKPSVETGDAIAQSSAASTSNASSLRNQDASWLVINGRSR
jgi:hypothetical protein